jgi:hypothetical protein
MFMNKVNKMKKGNRLKFYINFFYNIKSFKVVLIATVRFDNSVTFVVSYTWTVIKLSTVKYIVCSGDMLYRCLPYLYPAFINYHICQRSLDINLTYYCEQLTLFTGQNIYRSLVLCISTDFCGAVG